WDALPLAVRRRFSKRLAGGATLVYAGRVIETQMSLAGWCLAQATRLVGAPLPLGRERDVPAGVAVTEGAAAGGRARAPHLCALRRLSPGHPFGQTLRRPDRARGACRARRRHGAHGPRRRARAGFSQRRLFPARARPARDAARVALPWRPHGHSRRDPRRLVHLHTGARSPAIRRAHPPDRDFPGGRHMTALMIWPLIALQILMGAFDTLYHHELTERLAWRPSQARELRLHGVRNLVYAGLFLTLGWLEPYGIWAGLVIAALACEVVITLMDFVEEDLSRKLPASERINHTLLALNYGAILVLLVPLLIGWAASPAALVPVSYGIWSAGATAAAAGVALFGLRDLLASARARRLVPAKAAELMAALPAGQTVLITGATGFIGRRLVEALAAAGHQPIVLVRDSHKAAQLAPPFRLVTSLGQIPNDTRIDAIVNLAGEPIADRLWTATRPPRLLPSPPRGGAFPAPGCGGSRGSSAGPPCWSAARRSAGTGCGATSR